MNELITLVSPEGVRREILARLGSIGMREFYAANASDFHPEAKFILADYLDYNNEKLVIYEGEPFRVLRTYRNGLELELTVERAPAADFEEDEVDG